MKIEKKKEGSVLTVALGGSLDTMTSPELSGELRELDGVTELKFELANLSYVSSAGLRVFLIAYETVRKNGGTVSVSGANEDVRRIFHLVGFSKFINFV